MQNNHKIRSFTDPCLNAQNIFMMVESEQKKIKINEDLLNFEEAEGNNNLLLQTAKELQELLQKPETDDSKVIKPKPGFCVKAKDVIGDKVFLNICTSDELPSPQELSEDKLIEILESENAGEFRIPLSLGEPRKEQDKSGKDCTAYDIIVNSGFFKKAENSELFRTFLITVAIEGLEDKYSIRIEKSEWVILKNKKYLGDVQETRIQQRPKSLISEVDRPIVTSRPERKDDELMKSVSTRHLTERSHPQFKITYKRGCLLATVILPGVKNADVCVDVGEDRLTVTVLNSPLKLDTYLPVLVKQEISLAVFNSKSQILRVQMPVANVTDRS